MPVTKKIDYINYFFVLDRVPLKKNTNIYKNKLTSILRTAEKEYYSKVLTDAKGNIKSKWKILNSVINTKTNTFKLASHFECNGINIVSKQSNADEFNNFFVDVASNLGKMITVADNAASIYDYCSDFDYIRTDVSVSV